MCTYAADLKARHGLDCVMVHIYLSSPSDKLTSIERIAVFMSNNNLKAALIFGFCAFAVSVAARSAYLHHGMLHAQAVPLYHMHARCVSGTASQAQHTMHTCVKRLEKNLHRHMSHLEPYILRQPSAHTLSESLRLHLCNMTLSLACPAVHMLFVIVFGPLAAAL